MLDENDLRAIAKLISDSESRMTSRMAEEIAASETRMTEKITASETRMTEKIAAAETRMAEEIAASETRMTEKIAASETRMTEKIAASEARMTEEIAASETRLKTYVDEKVSTTQSHTLALIEAYFDPKFQAMGEKIDLLEEKMVTFEDLEDIETRLDVLEAVTRRNAREIEKLKKAQ